MCRIRKFLILFIISQMSVMPAIGAVCDAGFYMSDDGLCDQCPAGTYSAAGAATCTTVSRRYYATGCDDNGNKCTGQEKCKAGNYCVDGVMYPCPDAITHSRTTFPDNYGDNPVVQSTYITTAEGAAYDISMCSVITAIMTDLGRVFDYASYNPDTQEYDITSQHLWHIVSSGYYLTNPGPCGTYAYYTDIFECPAGHYCPGKRAVICNAENQAEVQTRTFGLGTCPDNTYSDTGAAACTPCPTGTGNAGNDASAHAGTSSCAPLCAAGYTKLHVGNRTFNLWPTDNCTSPSLRASINNDVCCVNMAPGNGPGINVELHNQIYHTTN